MSATPTPTSSRLRRGAGLMSLASRISALASRIGFEVKTKIDATIPAGPGVGVLRLRRRQVVSRRAQRGQRDPHGGGPLPRDLRRGHARRQLLLDGARPQQHQQRHAAHCHRAIQHRPEDRPVRRHQCATTRRRRSTTPPKSTWWCTADGLHQAQLDAVGSGAGQGREARDLSATRPSSTARVDELQAAIARSSATCFEQAVDTGLWPVRRARSGSPPAKGF
jgi:hypothetical protein